MSTPAELPRPLDAVEPAVEELLDGVRAALREHGRVDDDVWERALLAPARDVLARSGKGLRPRILEQAWRMGGGTPGALPRELPLAIELLHVGSLVVDDIEDDSRSRRGAPTLHRRFGVPLALNTANWLYFLAMDLVGRMPLPPSVRLRLHEDMTAALVRCHEGQALDLSVHVAQLHRTEVPDLVAAATRLKTGSLMALAARLGCAAAGGSEPVVSMMERFGRELGIGLQMLDDWSGISRPDRREKGLEDMRLGRPTWPWAWLAQTGDEIGYAEAARRARELSGDAEAARMLRRFRARLGPLAPGMIRAQLGRALGVLHDSVAEAGAVSAVRDDVRAMELAFLPE